MLEQLLLVSYFSTSFDLPFFWCPHANSLEEAIGNASLSFENRRSLFHHGDDSFSAIFSLAQRRSNASLELKLCFKTRVYSLINQPLDVFHRHRRHARQLMS